MLYRKYRSSLVGALGASAASDSGTETAKRHKNFLQSSVSVNNSNTLSPQNSLTLHSSTPLLRLRTSVTKSTTSSIAGRGKALDDVGSNSEDNPLKSSFQSVNLRRSWEQNADVEPSMEFSSFDDVPMLSSLSKPLRTTGFTPVSTTSASGSIISSSSVGKQRYEMERSMDDPTPSYISSAGSETINTRSQAGHSKFNPANRSNKIPSEMKGASFSERAASQEEKHRGEGKPHSEGKSHDDISSFQDSYSQGLSATNMSTLTSALPDGLSLSQTIDSEGEVLASRAGQRQIDGNTVQRRADAYEQQANRDLGMQDTPLQEYDADETASTTSPFRDFSRHGQTHGSGGSQDLETASVHSLALSDSHNTP
jgi:hypothetical protein